MELLKEQLQVSETKFRDKAIAYSDGDVIVPDVKPDILKILQVDAVSAITSKEISDGLIKVSGIIKYSILYIPDKEADTIKSISAEMNFSHTIDKKQLPSSAFLDVFSDIERVEFTLLNSRKLNIKTAVSIGYTVWENKEISLASGIDYEKAEVIYETLKTENLNVMEEYPFTVRDRLEIPSGRASVAEILKMDINTSDREIKAITGKAVIKGNISLCALYVDTNGEINCIDGEIPFTEIAEIFDLEEDVPCNVDYRLNDYSYEITSDDDGEPRAIGFDISILSVISSSEQKETQIMKDCFCPGCHTDMVYDSMEFENIISSGTNQYTIKEVVAPDKKIPQISSVYNVITRPSITKVTPSDGKISVEGRLDVYILYITDNTQIPIYSFKKDIPLNISIDNDLSCEGLDCSVDICVEHTTFNLNMANEVELRCILSANSKLSKKTNLDIISDCTMHEGEHSCGIVIYFVQPGDTLWQIAKRYSVSIADISKYNNIQDENSINVGQKLVIPFC